MKKTALLLLLPVLSVSALAQSPSGVPVWRSDAAPRLADADIGRGMAACKTVISSAPRLRPGETLSKDRLFETETGFEVECSDLFAEWRREVKRHGLSERSKEAGALQHTTIADTAETAGAYLKSLAPTIAGTTLSAADADAGGPGGTYRVNVAGQWIDVPPEVVVTEEGRAHPALVWTYQDADGVVRIRRFLPAGTP